MDKEKILTILQEYKQEFAKEYTITTLGIFGSVVRDEAGLNSDVDVVVRIKEPDLFMLAGIKDDLEKRFHRPVDIVTYRENMNQFLKKRIDREAIYV